MQLVLKIETDAVDLGTIVKFSSGLIGKDGQDSIISNEKKGQKWLPGMVSGGEINRYIIIPDGNYLLYDKAKIKSGYECVEYFKEKLFMRQTGDSLICAFDDENLLALNNVHIGNLIDEGYSLKFITALVNSKLLNFYYKAISLEAGRVMAQTDIETIEGLPVRRLGLQDQRPFIDVVDKILPITKKKGYKENSSLKAEVAHYAKQLDRLIYKHYGLSSEEIEMIEASGK